MDMPPPKERKRRALSTPDTLAKWMVRNAGMAHAQTRLAWPAFAASAIKKSKRNGPRGMGVPNLYARNSNGTRAIDPMSLNHVRKPHAVKVDPHVFDARQLRKLFAHNPRATNPLTRKPFPETVRTKYSPKTSGSNAASEKRVLGTALSILIFIQQYGCSDCIFMRNMYATLSTNDIHVELVRPDLIIVKYKDVYAFVYLDVDRVTPLRIQVLTPDVHGAPTNGFRSSRILESREIMRVLQRHR